MAKLSASQRAKLPDSAFAYIDARGRRLLPINDEAHVRNALARFEQVRFESDAARERSRKRLLNAAKRFGIVPVGFITTQLQSERTRSASEPLPTGFVTLLLTDIEDSTALLRQLGARYASLLRAVRTLIRQAVRRAGGREVDARADEFFAVFTRPQAAVEAAVALQRALAARSWPDQVQCRVRVGIHSGRPTVSDAGYVGLSVHTAARVSFAAHGGQILVTPEAISAMKGSPPPGVAFRDLGAHRLPGIPGLQPLFQVEADGLQEDFDPPRTTAPVAERADA